MNQRRRILQPIWSGLTVSQAALKYLGWMCTLAGIAALTVFPPDDMSATKMLLLLSSYIALPIFAFLTLEGIQHTSNVGEYMLRTLTAAVIAEPFYDYVRFGRLWQFVGDGGQNVLFSILLVQVMLYFLIKTEQGKLWGAALKAILVGASFLWAAILQLQYGQILVIFAAICYLCRNNKFLRGSLIFMASLATMFTPVISVLFLNRYDGRRGQYNKYVFYIIYPLLWIALAVLKAVG